MNWKSTRKLKTAIQENFSPDLNPLDYTLWGVLENKTNATSHPNISSPKTAMEEEWNKMSENFLKTCKLFRRCVDTIIEKMLAILSKFTVLGLSYFVVYFLKLKLKSCFIIVIYYYTRIFLIFLLLPYTHTHTQVIRYILF